MTFRQAEEPTFFQKLRSRLRGVRRQGRTHGHRVWAVAGGRIPPESRGDEPRHTSRDEIGILNTSRRSALVEVTVYYADRDPVGPYRFTVKGRRARNVRFNDLIDPEAIPLDTAYAALLESSTPVVVHFQRVDSGPIHPGMLGGAAFPVR